MRHAVQIIGGEYRSRKIEVIDADGLRPTASRVRETLFNWLQISIPGSIIIDAFAGTGALGIEALSRGAKRAIFIEKDANVFRTLAQNLRTLKVPEERYQLIKGSALEALTPGSNLHQEILEQLPQYPRQHLFLDPPFFHELYTPLLTILEGNPILSNLSSLSLEMPVKANFNLETTLAPLQLSREMKTKESKVFLYRVV